MVEHRTPLLVTVSVLQSTLESCVKVRCCLTHTHAHTHTRTHTHTHTHTRTHTHIYMECIRDRRTYINIANIFTTHCLLLAGISFLSPSMSIAYSTCHLPSSDTLLLGCVTKNCMNGGTQDPSTCDCVCLQQYIGGLCESKYCQMHSSAAHLPGFYLPSQKGVH